MIWRSVKEGLKCFRDVMILVRSKWDMPWCQESYASDASMIGWGMTKAICDTARVSKVARVIERMRFKLAAEKAREHALGAGGYMLDHFGTILKDVNGEPCRSSETLIIPRTPCGDTPSPIFLGFRLEF